MVMLRSFGSVLVVLLGAQFLAVPGGEAQEEGKNIVIGSPGTQPILPPELPWSGRSHRLARPAGDPWATPCEQTRLLDTPRYDETMAWLRRLSAASDYLEMISLGKSPEGRDIWMVVASQAEATSSLDRSTLDRPSLRRNPKSFDNPGRRRSASISNVLLSPCAIEAPKLASTVVFPSPGSELVMAIRWRSSAENANVVRSVRKASASTEFGDV